MCFRSRLCVVAGIAIAATGLAIALRPSPARVVADEPKAAPVAPTAETGMVGKGDHYMFGNSPERNFINLNPVSLSHEFPKSPDDDKVHVLGNRVKWKEQLGSRAYGGPTIAGGKVFVGTNNDNPRNKRDRGKPTDDSPDGPPLDKANLMCFE